MGSLQLIRMNANRKRLGDCIRQRNVHLSYLQDIGYPPSMYLTIDKLYSRKIFSIISELGGLAGEW